MIASFKQEVKHFSGIKMTHSKSHNRLGVEEEILETPKFQMRSSSRKNDINSQTSYSKSKSKNI